VTAEPGEPTNAGTGPAGPSPYPGNAPPPPPSSGPGRYGSTEARQPAFPTQAAGVASANPYATWGVRVGGYLIDFAIFLVVFLLLFLVFRHSNTLDVHLMARRGVRRRHLSALPFLVTGVLFVVYGTLMCGSPQGQTVGMMAVGVRAVRDETLGELGYARALGRALFEGLLRLINLLFFLLGLVWVLDMLFPLWDPKRQTLHDKVAGSVVLRVRPAG
jgi:uncharacterized RDD family membrane protein YckC